MPRAPATAGAVPQDGREVHMDRKFRVAVVGATGLVGETMISVLEERDFPVAQLYALASERSLGRSVSFRGRSYPVRELKTFDFAQCDFALFSAGAAVSREHVPRARRRRLPRHRQHLRVPLPRGCAARRAGSEPAGTRRHRHERDHCQPELLDDSAGGGAQAALRRRRHRAHRCRDLPVRLRGRPGGARGTRASVDRGVKR